MKDLNGEIHDTRPAKVKFIVFGSDFYRYWCEYNDLLKLDDSDRMGLSVCYYQFNKTKPCWANLQFAKVENVYTCFVDACGSYVNHPELEKFVFNLCGMKPGHDNYTNEDNFHNHIAWRKLQRQELRKRLQNKYMKDLETAARNLKNL
jgi:hypothetical protein